MNVKNWVKNNNENENTQVIQPLNLISTGQRRNTGLLRRREYISANCALEMNNNITHTMIMSCERMLLLGLGVVDRSLSELASEADDDGRAFAISTMFDNSATLSSDFETSSIF